MKDFFDLTEQANKDLIENNNVNCEIEEKIKSVVSNKGYIGVAQINTKPGDIESNAKKIAKYIKFADKIGLEMVVFPELSLMGYPLNDTLRRHPFLVDENLKWLNGLAKLVKNTVALVGFVEPAKEDKNLFYNSVAVLKSGVVIGTVRKSIINKFEVATDNKNFVSSSDVGFIKTDNSFASSSSFDYRITVGEDYQTLNDESANLESELQKNNFKLMINCSAQISNIQKENIKSCIFSRISSMYKKPFIFVNQVGCNDCYVFDGLSAVYNSDGKLLARAKAYEEQFLIVNPYLNVGKIYDICEGFNETPILQKSFSLNYEGDMERIYKALVAGIKDYFNKCGLKHAVLGLSGGLDSTVCAVLLADALGKENVFGISMPSKITSSESKSDAKQLATNLGIHFTEIPIKDIVDTTNTCFQILFKEIESKWDFRYKKSYTFDNIQARSRAMYLWGVSNEFDSCIPIATSDKSEAYMGYATINGDMSGGFAPIADITKTKLFALARWLNKNRNEKNVIPESIIQKSPGAELAIDPKTNKPLRAEDALMPYEFLDEVIWRIENKKESYNELLASEFTYEKKYNLTKIQKSEWLDKFYSRMSKAFYKWSIMPPAVKIEPHSISKCDYTQPITSVGINYKGSCEEHINECLTMN